MELREQEVMFSGFSLIGNDEKVLEMDSDDGSIPLRMFLMKY